MCSDDLNTVVVRTEKLNHISDLVFNGDKGSVVVEAGVDYIQR